MIKNILFDLDGTLINTLQAKFNEKFYKKVYDKFLIEGYDAELLSSTIVGAIKAMVLNDGECSNENVFWNYFENSAGMKKEKFLFLFNDFYNNDYDDLSDCVELVEGMGKAINDLKEKGYNLILATNPLFPRIAIEKRAMWGDIDCNKFNYVTSYENSSYAKPNINYYKEIIENNNLKAEETIMFGNDLIEDLVIEQLDIPCFIITNNMVNSKNLENCTKKGDYNDFYSFISNLPNIN